MVVFISVAKIPILLQQNHDIAIFWPSLCLLIFTVVSQFLQLFCFLDLANFIPMPMFATLVFMHLLAHFTLENYTSSLEEIYEVSIAYYEE